VHTDSSEALLRVGPGRRVDEGRALATNRCDAEKLPYPDEQFRSW